MHVTLLLVVLVRGYSSLVELHILFGNWLHYSAVAIFEILQDTRAMAPEHDLGREEFSQTYAEQDRKLLGSFRRRPFAHQHVRESPENVPPRMSLKLVFPLVVLKLAKAGSTRNTASLGVRKVLV